MITSVAQRWRARRTSYRPAGETAARVLEIIRDAERAKTAAVVRVAAGAEPEEVVDEFEERAPRKLRVAR